MCPIVNLNICDGLYEKYLGIKGRLDKKQYHEEPEGVIRFREKTQGFIAEFWNALGFQYPLLCYVFSDTPEYHAMLEILKVDSSSTFLDSIHIYNAETGEPYPLASNSDGEPVLLAIHAKPFPQLEKKLLSVFDLSDPDKDDDEDGRECRTRTRGGDGKEQRKPSVHEDGRSCIAAIKLDYAEQEFLRLLTKQEQDRRRKNRTALDNAKFSRREASMAINDRGGRK